MSSVKGFGSGDRPSDSDFAWKRPFLLALRQTGVVFYACEQAHIARAMAYRARRADPQFREDWETAMQEGIDQLEAVAFERARSGLSDVLLIFLLKNKRRHIYGDKIQIDFAAVTKLAQDLGLDEDDIMQEAEAILSGRANRDD